MKYGLLGTGVVLLLAGLVWTLQGLNIVKGSFMTGSTLWLMIGLLCLVGGGAVSFVGFRLQRRGR